MKTDTVLQKTFRVTGAELRAAWEAAKANTAAFAACKRHRFIGGRAAKLGEKHTCEVCGAHASIVDVGHYIAGYQAAGGDANDIWPGWTDVR